MGGRNGDRGGWQLWTGIAGLWGWRCGAAVSQRSTWGRLHLVCLPVVLVYVLLSPVDRLHGDGDVAAPQSPWILTGTWILQGFRCLSALCPHRFFGVRDTGTQSHGESVSLSVPIVLTAAWGPES